MKTNPVAGNLLLATLPEACQAALEAHLDPVELQRGDVICEPGAQLTHAYFPVTAVVSLLAVGRKGASTELAVTGREGVVGAGLILGGLPSTYRAVVHVAGHALRLSAARLVIELASNGPLQQLLLRFTQALLAQISQAVVCNRHHSVEQALCRWLLMIGDRVGSDELLVTQQLIADSLGVRREGITEAAGRLQEAGCIRSARGRIEVTDRAALKARSCECYAVVAEEFELLLGSSGSPSRTTPPTSTRAVMPPRPRTAL